MNVPAPDRSNNASNFLRPIPSRVKSKLSAGLGILHGKAKEILSKIPKDRIVSLKDKIPSKSEIKSFVKGISDHQFTHFKYNLKEMAEDLKDKASDITADLIDKATDLKDEAADKISARLKSIPMNDTTKKTILICAGFFAIGIGAALLGSGAGAPVGAFLLGLGILSVTVGVIYPHSSESRGILRFPDQTSSPPNTTPPTSQGQDRIPPRPPPRTVT